MSPVQTSFLSSRLTQQEPAQHFHAMANRPLHASTWVPNGILSNSLCTLHPNWGPETPPHTCSSRHPPQLRRGQIHPSRHSGPKAGVILDTPLSHTFNASALSHHVQNRSRIQPLLNPCMSHPYTLDGRGGLSTGLPAPILHPVYAHMVTRGRCCNLSPLMSLFRLQPSCGFHLTACPHLCPTRPCRIWPHFPPCPHRQPCLPHSLGFSPTHFIAVPPALLLGLCTYCVCSSPHGSLLPPPGLCSNSSPSVRPSLITIPKIAKHFCFLFLFNYLPDLDKNKIQDTKLNLTCRSMTNNFAV